SRNRRQSADLVPLALAPKHAPATHAGNIAAFVAGERAGLANSPANWRLACRRRHAALSSSAARRRAGRAPDTAGNDGSQAGRDQCACVERALAIGRTVVSQRSSYFAALAALLAACLAPLAAQAQQRAQDSSILVFAAASMKNALDDVDVAFGKQ